MKGTLFVVVRTGIYDQVIVGVYDTIEKAKEGVRWCKVLEKDDYHDFEIREYNLNDSNNPDTVIILCEDEDE